MQLIREETAEIRNKYGDPSHSDSESTQEY